MKIVMRDGRVFQGTPKQIVQGMQDIAFSARDLKFSDYIDWVVQNALRFDEAELRVQGDSDDERASSLVSEMIRTGLARKG
jgi:hypothetical protein